LRSRARLPRVVKAFNTFRRDLANHPKADGGQRVLFYSGNDTAAKAEVAALIDRNRFVGIVWDRSPVGGQSSLSSRGHCRTRIWSRSLMSLIGIFGPCAMSGPESRL